MLLLVGRTCIELMVALAVTVAVALPVSVPDCALIVTAVDVLTFPAVARPAASIAKAVAFPELQVTLPVRSFVDWSLYVPVAVYCCVAPLASVTVAGPTEIDFSVGLVTVPVAVFTNKPLMADPLVAVTVKLPAPTVANSPPELIVATLDGVTVQVVEALTLPVLPSEYVPVAVYC
jgi:hypothetical protein